MSDLAKKIYSAWADDARHQLDHSPQAFFWAEIAADVAISPPTDAEVEAVAQAIHQQRKYLHSGLYLPVARAAIEAFLQQRRK